MAAWQDCLAIAITPLSLLSYHHVHCATKPSWWKWCNISERTANWTKPSKRITVGYVDVRVMAAQLVLQSWLL
jgi:hypothetical protein